MDITQIAVQAPHVYTAINAVQADLAKVGISKDHRNTQGAGFNFRGIDDVLNALSGLMAKHSLVILPRVLSREVTERQSKNGGALFYVTIQCDFDIVSSLDGSKHTVSTFGEAMDSGDKATNKAMSAAYKYMAIQSFAIPTKGDNDADASTHEVVSISEELQAKLNAATSVLALNKLYNDLSEDARRTAKPAFSKRRAAIESADGIL